MRIFLRATALATLLTFAASCGGGGGGGGVDDNQDAVVEFETEVVSESLNFPTGLAAAPDGRLFISQLDGNIRVLVDGELLAQPVLTLPTPNTGGEGILGIALDPDFSSNGFLYTFYTDPAVFQNQILRFKVRENRGLEPTLILGGLPVGGHNGGKLVFDEDGELFASIGDVGRPELSQDINSLAGKILRITPDGGVPKDNPFPGSPVWALGFRNPFGLAIHPSSGVLYATENGPECNDELNRVVAGANFGWRPDQSCTDTDPAFVQPISVINPSVGITGAVFYRGSMFSEFKNNLLVGDFNTGTIRRYLIDEGAGGAVVGEAIVLPGSGEPVLAVAVDRKGVIYYTTPTALKRLVRK